MIGRSLGNYRIIEQIGIGGMATVYKAYDPVTDRYVALKILPDYYSHDPKFRLRFEREAKATARLEHLHILPVHTYGEDGTTAYLVMRYMATGTLKERIQAGPMPFAEASRLLKQIAGALDYAHQHGVLHRDVKPSNVLLDAENNAYLTDFGIARMIEGASELTGSGLIGTPQYMSPEQCQGRKDVTEATDIYSLGVLLYEMVTGRTPYQADTPLAIIHMQLSSTPLPIPRSMRPELPQEAEAVILKALASKPEKRWTSCMAMAEAFAEAVAVTPVIQEPDSQAVILKKPLKRGLSIALPAGIVIDDDHGTTTSLKIISRPVWHNLPLWSIGLAGLVLLSAVTGIVWATTSSQSALDVFACSEQDGNPGLCISGVKGGRPSTILADSSLVIGHATWSPDGKRIVFNGRMPAEDLDSIYFVDVDGSNLTRLPRRCHDVDPVWSPDGNWIIFHSCDDLILMHADGSEQLNLKNQCVLSSQWSPDSAWIVVSVGLDGQCAGERPITREIRIISSTSNTAWTLATTTSIGTAHFEVAFSPDGKKVAYVDDEGQTWVIPVDNSGEPIQLSEFPLEWTARIHPQWAQ